MSRENPVCPHCGGLLSYRDTRIRIWKWYSGIRRTIRVRRLRCQTCGRLHVELPDVLVPHKHYGSEVIENVADGVSTPDDPATEDYPCIKTMERWKSWIAVNVPQIDGYLRSVGTRFLGMHESLLASTESLLTKLRDNGAGWLALVAGIICRAGGALLSAARPGIYAPDLSVCPSGQGVSSSHKEDMHHDNIRYSRDLAKRESFRSVSDDLSAPGSRTG